MMEWLKQQPDPNTEPETWEVAPVTLHEMMKADHIVPAGGSISPFTTFSVSEKSGSVGIAVLKAKPSLSAIFSGTDKPVHILSIDEVYVSTSFLTISDEEFLATTSTDRIQIWGLTKNTSREACRFEESGLWHLCAIDERTVACVAELPTSDGFSKVYILNTETEKFHLSSTLRVKTGHEISDIYFVKTPDGTACLLVSFPTNSRIQLVEMVGGKVRWQVDKNQMGGSSGMRTSFRPWSICTDGDTVFVVDLIMNSLRRLSVEDGSILTSISLYPFGIKLPSCVRLQGNYLHIGHMNKKGDTYYISKFTNNFEP